MRNVGIKRYDNFKWRRDEKMREKIRGKWEWKEEEVVCDENKGEMKKVRDGIKKEGNKWREKGKEKWKGKGMEWVGEWKMAAVGE